MFEELIDGAASIRGRIGDSVDGGVKLRLFEPPDVISPRQHGAVDDLGMGLYGSGRLLSEEDLQPGLWKALQESEQRGFREFKIGEMAARAEPGDPEARLASVAAKGAGRIWDGPVGVDEGDVLVVSADNLSQIRAGGQHGGGAFDHLLEPEVPLLAHSRAIVARQRRVTGHGEEVVIEKVDQTPSPVDVGEGVLSLLSGEIADQDPAIADLQAVLGDPGLAPVNGMAGGLESFDEIEVSGRGQRLQLGPGFR